MNNVYCHYGICIFGSVNISYSASSSNNKLIQRRKKLSCTFSGTEKNLYVFEEKKSFTLHIPFYTLRGTVLLFMAFIFLTRIIFQK